MHPVRILAVKMMDVDILPAYLIPKEPLIAEASGFFLRHKHFEYEVCSLMRVDYFLLYDVYPLLIAPAETVFFLRVIVPFWNIYEDSRLFVLLDFMDGIIYRKRDVFLTNASLLNRLHLFVSKKQRAIWKTLPLKPFFRNPPGAFRTGAKINDFVSFFPQAIHALNAPRHCWSILEDIHILLKPSRIQGWMEKEPFRPFQARDDFDLPIDIRNSIADIKKNYASHNLSHNNLLSAKRPSSKHCNILEDRHTYP